jgi:hypothetical protein
MYAQDMFDVYAVAVDGILPHLQSLRVRICSSDTDVVTRPLPPISSLRLAELDTLYLIVLWTQRAIEWETVEAFTSLAVMPRLRCCTLDYPMKTCTDIRRIFDSPLFGNDERHVRVRFLLIANLETYGDLSDDDDQDDNDDDDDRFWTVHSAHYDEIYQELVSTFAL